MPEASIRFAVRNAATTHRAASWKCWTLVGGGKSDVYLACRELNGELKASLHESGYWHVAFSAEFHERQAGAAGDDRRVQAWARPAAIADGLTLAYTIITPSGVAMVPIDADKCKGVTWIDEPPAGRAIEFNVLLSPRATPDLPDWPGRLSMGTHLLRRFDLDDGTTAWVVWYERAMPKIKMPEGSRTGRYFQGKGADDLKGDGVRMLVFGEVDNGCRAMIEMKVEIGP